RHGARGGAAGDARRGAQRRPGSRSRPGPRCAGPGHRPLRTRDGERNRGIAMSTDRPLSSAITSLVVGSRYLPVYIALILLVVVAAIWAPATLSPAGLSAIAPFGTFLAIATLGQMLVIMTGGIDLSVPGTFTLGALI